MQCRNWLKCVYRSYGNCVRGSLPWAVSVSFSVLSPPDWLKIKWSGRILLLHTFGKSLPQCCCSLFSVSSMPVRRLKWLKQITGDPSQSNWRSDLIQPSHFVPDRRSSANCSQISQILQFNFWGNFTLANHSVHDYSLSPARFFIKKKPWRLIIGNHQGYQFFFVMIL